MNKKLFKVDDSLRKLEKNRREIFHSFVMKTMFLVERGIPDVNPVVIYLSSRVNFANENDWNKLMKMLGFLKGTKNDVLTLGVYDSHYLTWFIDASFAIHADKKSHTGAVFTLGEGVIIIESTKQKVNSRISTESELIAIDDKIGKVMWVKRFLEYQNYKINSNLIYQDNESTLKLERNSKESFGKRTRHFDIKYFYITNLIKRNEVKVRHWSTDAER